MKETLISVRSNVLRFFLWVGIWRVVKEGGYYWEDGKLGFGEPRDWAWFWGKPW